MNYLFVGLGGALGSIARFWISGLVAGSFGERFPFGTLIVNITGCFIIGLFAALSDAQGRMLAGAGVRLFFMTGICGGYTTFSSFSLQTLNLARDGEWLWAGWNILGSVVLCMAGVWLGHVAGQLINR